DAHVDVNAGGTAHLTDDGTDDDAAPNVDDHETVDDSAILGQTAHVHADTTGDATAVRVDQTLTGTVTLGATENDTDTTNPNDTDGDVATGSLGGTVGGGLHQAGTFFGGWLTPGAVTGDFGLNLTGSASNGTVETIDAPAGSGRWFPVPDEFDVSGLVGYFGTYTGHPNEPAL